MASKSKSVSEIGLSRFEKHRTSTGTAKSRNKKKDPTDNDFGLSDFKLSRSKSLAFSKNVNIGPLGKFLRTSKAIMYANRTKSPMHNKFMSGQSAAEDLSLHKKSKTIVSVKDIEDSRN